MVVNQSILPTVLGLLASFAVVVAIAVILMRIFKWNRSWQVYLVLAPMVAVALLVFTRTSRNGPRVYITENQAAFEEPVAERPVSFDEFLAQRPRAVVSKSPPAPLVLPAAPQRPTAPVKVRSSFPPPAAAVRTETTAWTTPDLPGFKADLYPSAQAAVRGLAADALCALGEVLDSQKPPESIDVCGDVPADILTAVAGVLGGHNRSAKVNVFGDPRQVPKAASPEAPHVLVHVRIDLSRPETGSSTHQHSLPSHRVQLAVQGPKGERLYTADFVDKPWFDNFAKFTAGHPQDRWLLAQSHNACTSPGEAESSASQDAAKKLALRVLDKLNRSHGNPWSSMSPPRLDRIEKIVLADLDACVSDRFIQSYSRPYGQVWRAAFLVNTSDRNINSLASSCERLLRSDRRTWVATFASIGGLVALICLIYVFLNVMTRGYYTRLLRATAAGVVLVGIAATLFFVWRFM